MNPYVHLIKHSGIQPLFHAIEMSVHAICDNYPLHIHTEGLRGTGKTSVIRAARHILPPITRIKGCVYNCDPNAPHCPLHRELTVSQVQALGTEVVPRPFLEISHSAKPGSIVGSIDLSKLTDQNTPLAAVLPGTIPQAHRGIIFVDEINRLADTAPELADILLDVMGTKPGRIQIEEPGLPTIEMPVSVSIWAASNPDEDPGALRQIRRQLSDRFDLTVPVSQPENIQSVVDILKSRRTSLKHLEQPIFTFGTVSMSQVELPDDIEHILASIYVNFKLESLRAIEAVESSAILEALLNEHQQVTLDHLTRVIPFTLGHRTDTTTIEEILQYLAELKDPRQSSAAALPALPIAKPSSRKPESWWQKILQDLAAKFNRKETNLATPEKHQQQKKAEQEMAILKPTEATVSAPLKTAAPLAQLPDHKLISLPEHHDQD
jgi:magnesium chelatase subunit I